jgi:EAL domain-containing protein (putative c-di-GMP-specific phosphodiesterase class I)
MTVRDYKGLILTGSIGWSGPFMNATVKNGTAGGNFRGSESWLIPRNFASEMRRAFSDAEFSLVYQPMIDLHTGRTTTCEALLRWNHPSRGVILPGNFVSLVEEFGFMPRLGRWVLHAALAEAATWPGGTRVAVNISAAQFLAGDLAQVVRDALTAANLDPGRLELEVAETIQPLPGNAFLRTLRQLRCLGVLLSIDDFGVGHSSFDRLRDFAFDKIKIDRSFVSGFPGRADHAGFVRAIIQFGTELGIPTTAEGAETRSEVDGLRAERCTEAQGFFFSHAHSGAGIRDFISRAQRRRIGGFVQSHLTPFFDSA